MTRMSRISRRHRFAGALGFALVLIGGVMMAGVAMTGARAAELIMLREHGCSYCLLWERQVGAVYDKTDEGRRVRLRRIDIHEPLPDDLGFLVKGRYTPTFILVDGGAEIGRIRGYPGEDFFWGLLGQLIARLPPDEAVTEADGEAVRAR